MVTIWILVLFAGEVDMTLAAYPTKEACEEIRSHATDKHADLQCIGIVRNELKLPPSFKMKNWF